MVAYFYDDAKFLWFHLGRVKLNYELHGFFLLCCFLFMELHGWIQMAVSLTADIVARLHRIASVLGCIFTLNK